MKYKSNPKKKKSIVGKALNETVKGINLVKKRKKIFK